MQLALLIAANNIMSFIVANRVLIKQDKMNGHVKLNIGIVYTSLTALDTRILTSDIRGLWISRQTGDSDQRSASASVTP